MSQESSPVLEDLHIGVAVHGSDGKHLGSLSRIIIEPASEQVTHLIVEPGLIESGDALKPGGWETARERVVPMKLVASANKDDVRLTTDEAAFLQLPLFERIQYTEASETTAQGASGKLPSRFRFGQLLNFVSAGWGLGAAPFVPPADVTFNETPTSVAIEEGAPVWRLEPREEIGTVERVLVDAATQRVSELVVRRAGLLHHRVLLPIDQVRGLEGGVVLVVLSPAEVDALAHYMEEP